MSNKSKGEILRAERTKQRYSLRGLSKQCGVSANTLCFIENGQSHGRMDTWEKISLALGIPLEKFFRKEKKGEGRKIKCQTNYTGRK